MVRRNVVAPLAGARLPVFELCQVYPIMVRRNVVAPRWVPGCPVREKNLHELYT